MRQATTIFELAGCTVRLYDGWSETECFGEKITALHSEQPGQREVAEQIGYSGTIEQMNREHDLTHLLLNHWLGHPGSPALAEAGGHNGSELGGLEEAAVLAVQAYASALGLSLEQIAKRESANASKHRR